MAATKTVKVKDLQLAQNVRLFEEPFGWGTVIEVTAEEVVVRRPFMHTGDFSYTGGVLSYFGHEDVRLWRESDRPIEVSTEKVKKLR